MADIVVLGGCGHVGLPLALAFAKAGRSVVAYDIDAAKVAQVNAGRMPFLDRGADALLPEMLASGRLRCETAPDCLATAETIITVTGTPVDEHLNPRLELLFEVLSEHRERLRDGQLLVVRSTVYPGTTEQVHARLRAWGLDLDVAFCPERVAEGVALEEITSLPQLVAGCTPRAQARAEALFGELAPRIVPLRPLEAELAKLFTNAWRYVQFAVANQFFTMANNYGVDFYRVHHAMTDGYPRAAHFPRAGFAAGPCLFKDTMQLSAFDQNHFFLGHSAMLVNEGLPSYLVERARLRFPLADMRVAVLGMTFKKDSDDSRDSLSFKLRRLLVAHAREVLCHDPFLDAPWLVDLEEALAADLIFVGAPHSAYAGLDVGATPVIDPWNVVPGRLEVI
ncbi:MAG: nucleotide sugar dehydrogenase [Planctomycetota bacterium]|nr:MAG: nucleotide sugar dehydrogenase [Planctomycetota bacterium]